MPDTAGPKVGARSGGSQLLGSSRPLLPVRRGGRWTGAAGPGPSGPTRCRPPAPFAPRPAPPPRAAAAAARGARASAGSGHLSRPRSAAPSRIRGHRRPIRHRRTGLLRRGWDRGRGGRHCCRQRSGLHTPAQGNGAYIEAVIVVTPRRHGEIVCSWRGRWGPRGLELQGRLLGTSRSMSMARQALSATALDSGE